MWAASTLGWDDTVTPVKTRQTIMSKVRPYPLHRNLTGQIHTFSNATEEIRNPRNFNVASGWVYGR